MIGTFAKWQAIRRDLFDDQSILEHVVRSLITDIRYQAEADGAAITGYFTVQVDRDRPSDFFVRNLGVVLVETPVARRFTPLGEQFGRAGQPFRRPRWFWGR